jgi:hypothetical protein
MAKNDQEEAFDKILTANLQRIIEFLKYAEAKNCALLTLASVWALASINFLTAERPIPVNYRASLLWAFPFVIAAGLAAILSFTPRLRLAPFLGGRRAGPHPRNLLYFGDIRSLTVARVEANLQERYYPPDEHVTTESYIHDLSVQIAVNSQIVRRKLWFFSIGIGLMAAAIVVPLLRLGWLCVSAKVGQWH